MFQSQIAQAVMAAPTHAALDALSKAVWQGYGAGAVREEDAQRLADMIEARRAGWREPKRKPLDLAPKPSLFARARLQRPPERARAIERRRRLASSGPLPPALAYRFTTAELAVLRIVSDEVRERDSCRRTYAEIAARAGTSRTTAQNAIRLAKRLGLVSVEERRRPGHKSLPNVVRIVARDWLSWMARGAKSIGFKKSDTTDTGFQSQRPQSGHLGQTAPKTAWGGRGRDSRDGGWVRPRSL